MKILFIGDIVGKSGRRSVRDLLPKIKIKYQPDFVIANAENSAHGKGITPKIFHELLSYGIDCITLGNHAYAKNNVSEILNDKRLVSPGNYQKIEGGNGIRYFEILGQEVGVINLLGQVFMTETMSSPFEFLNDKLKNNVTYIVDFHGEATGEKAIFARYYSKQIAACLGTHTHVQTADERIIDNCGFISDVGMCGAYESVLGRDINEVTNMTISNKTSRYTVAEGPYEFNAVLLNIINNKCNSIERIHILEKK